MWSKSMEVYGSGQRTGLGKVCADQMGMDNLTFGFVETEARGQGLGVEGCGQNLCDQTVMPEFGVRVCGSKWDWPERGASSE